MKRELLILRHGKADKEVQCMDYDRPLHDDGKRATQRVGVWLAYRHLAPDYIISSPAPRALVSAERICKAMGRYAGDIVQDKRLYTAGPSTLLQVLGDCPQSSERVLLVGHNPGLKRLLEYLVDIEISRSNKGKLLPPATLARLSMPASWSKLPPNCASLEDLIRPSQLPEKFPFPDHNGTELRDRPAYYYSQSSVIPYRITKNKVEILIIQSSQKKHFVVPKGIKEPALSPQDSAAKEAEEEAGVRGRVSDAAIGCYWYEKWGANCRVDVFAMEVKRIIPDDQWEESHRGREWVTPEQAVRRLKQRELRPIVMALANNLRSA